MIKDVGKWQKDFKIDDLARAGSHMGKGSYSGAIRQ